MRWSRGEEGEAEQKGDTVSEDTRTKRKIAVGQLLQ